MSASPAAAARSDGPLWAVRDISVLTLRNLRHFARQPQLLVLATVQPVIFVLLFVYVFGGAIGTTLPQGIEYVDFLLPGVFVQTVILGATQTAVGLASDLELGVIDRIRSMPAAQGAVLAARACADLVRNLWTVAVMVTVGYALGFRFTEGVLAALAAVAVVLALGFAMSWIFAFLAMVTNSAESAQAVGSIAIFPLVFASSVFVPVATFPGWLEAFAAHSPVTSAANATRALAVGVGDPTTALLTTVAWVLGLLALFVPLALWRYRERL